MLISRELILSNILKHNYPATSQIIIMLILSLVATSLYMSRPLSVKSYRVDYSSNNVHHFPPNFVYHTWNSSYALRCRRLRPTYVRALIRCWNTPVTRIWKSAKHQSLVSCKSSLKSFDRMKWRVHALSSYLTLTLSKLLIFQR